MTTELLKSISITDMDASPVIRDSAGKGRPGALQQVNDYITTTTGKTVGSIYRFVRVPSNCKVKAITLDSAAQGSSTAFDFGAYYSDDPSDPNYKANAGAVISAGFFATAVDCSSAVRATNITNESGSYTVDKTNKDLWDALGLATDPKGYFDLAATSTATINTGALMGIQVSFVD